MLAKLIARLGSEPYSYTPSVIGNMTEYQLDAMLRTRKKDSIREKHEIQSPRDLFAEWARNNRIPKWLEDRLWADNQNKSGVIPPMNDG